MSRIREINRLLREVDDVCKSCGNFDEYCDDKKDIDPFDRAKLDFQEQKDDFEERIESLEELKKKTGEVESRKMCIKLKLKVGSDIKLMEGHLVSMKHQHEESIKSGFFKRQSVSDEVKRDREHLLEILDKDLKYMKFQAEVEDDSDEKNDQVYDLARRAKERRSKRLQEAPQPLTENQKLFLEKSMENNVIIDEKLESLNKGLKIMSAMAEDVNEELKLQNEIINVVSNKMKDVDGKIKNRTKQVQTILRQSGGLTKWCPVFVLLILILSAAVFFLKPYFP